MVAKAREHMNVSDGPDGTEMGESISSVEASLTLAKKNHREKA